MMVRCNVHCRGHTPPPSPSPASAALSRSEDKFAQEIIDVCQRHAADWTSAQFCEWVQNLDVQVQTGSVRRQAAAFAATCTHPSMVRRVSCNLLYVVLHRGRYGHMNPCHCVDTVLGWGTCPTLVYVVPKGHVLGALGLDIEWTRHMHANLLGVGDVPVDVPYHLGSVLRSPAGAGPQFWYGWLGTCPRALAPVARAAPPAVLAHAGRGRPPLHRSVKPGAHLGLVVPRLVHR
jgi:hypothetical protein